MDNITINELCEKLFGIVVEKQLNWKRHIQSVSDKLSKPRGILHLTRDCLDESSLILTYYGLVYPALIYCQTIWGAVSTTALQPLNKVQKHAIRTLIGLKRRDNTNEAFYNLRTFKLSFINTLQCAVFAYKCLNGLISQENYFAYNIKDTHSRRNVYDVRIPYMTLFQFHTNIRYHGANICNLPGAIRRKPSLASFKSSLKKKKKKNISLYAQYSYLVIYRCVIYSYTDLI